MDENWIPAVVTYKGGLWTVIGELEIHGLEYLQLKRLRTDGDLVDRRFKTQYVKKDSKEYEVEGYEVKPLPMTARWATETWE